MQWSEGIQEFGFDCKVRKLSPKTIDNYSKQLRYFQRYLQSEFELVEIEQVKAYHIKQFLAWMDDKGRQPRYINDLLKVFKTFFNYMVKESHMAESPAAKVKNMKQPKTKIITFSENEIRKILNFYSGRTYLEIRNRTMIAMFFDTGIASSFVIFVTIRKFKTIQD